MSDAPGTPEFDPEEIEDDLTISRMVELAQKLALSIVIRVLVVVAAIAIPAATIGVMYLLDSTVPVPTFSVQTASGQSISVSLTWVVSATVSAIIVTRLYRLNFASWPTVVYRGLLETGGTDNAEDSGEVGSDDGTDDEGNRVEEGA